MNIKIPDIKIPLHYPSKSHRRHYEKQAKKMEYFLRSVFKKINKHLNNYPDAR